MKNIVHLLKILSIFSISSSVLSMKLSEPTRMKQPEPSLHQAVEVNDLKTVFDLLEKGIFNVNAPNSFGQTALMKSAAFGRATIMLTLLNPFQAAVNVKDNEGKTALHYAASKPLGDIDHVLGNIRLLVERDGNEIDAQSKNGMTPLHIAVLEGQDEVALLLIALGADKKVRDKNGKLPYHYVEKKNSRILAKALALNVEITPDQLRRTQSQSSNLDDSKSPSNERLAIARAMLNAQRRSQLEAEVECEEDAQEDTTSQGE